MLTHRAPYAAENMAKPFTIPEVNCLLLQLLSGLEYLHDYWVLHRDLKSSNILVNNRGGAVQVESS